MDSTIRVYTADGSCCLPEIKQVDYPSVFLTSSNLVAITRIRYVRRQIKLYQTWLTKAREQKRMWDAGIAIGQFDIDPQFTYEDMKRLLRKHKIECRWSPVGQNEINGLAEVNNK